MQNSEKDSNEASSETIKLRQLLDKTNSRISELKSENEELNNQTDESLKTQSELDLKNKKTKRPIDSRRTKLPRAIKRIELNEKSTR